MKQAYRLAAVCTAFVFASAAHSSNLLYTPTSVERNAIYSYFETDASAFLQGAEPQASYSFTDTPGSALANMEAAYKNNELSADLIYKGKRFIISGPTRSIKTSFDGRPVIDFENGKPFTVSAYFSNDKAPLLAALSKGQVIVLECTGDGAALSSPSLVACEFADHVMPDLTSQAMSQADSFLSGKPASDSLKNGIVFALAASAVLPSSQSCANAGQECAQQIFATYKTEDGKVKLNEQFPKVWAALKEAGIDTQIGD